MKIIRTPAEPTDAEFASAVETIQAWPFAPDVDNENDPSDTALYRAVRNLVANAVERGVSLHMITEFLNSDLSSLETHDA